MEKVEEGWKRATESQLGDLRTSHSVEAVRCGEERKDQSVKMGFETVSFLLFFFLHHDVDAGRLGGASSLPDLHVVGREEAVGASAHASPPAFVDHLDVGDDVIGVEGYLVITG